MKYLFCDKCNKRQSTGKFCLDCGKTLKEVVSTEVKFRPIESSRTSEQLKRDVRVWLNRIGVQNTDIQIRSGTNEVEIEYVLNRSRYSFKSYLQNKLTDNLAAVEQFLHYRVLGIERGIETLEKAFAGYEALPDYSDGKNFEPYLALGFKEKVDFETAKAKFRELAKRFHPDVNNSSEANNQFASIKKAIEMIEIENGK